jgi:hypothetical protein
MRRVAAQLALEELGDLQVPLVRVLLPDLVEFLVVARESEQTREDARVRREPSHDIAERNEDPVVRVLVLGDRLDFVQQLGEKIARDLPAISRRSWKYR